MHEQFAIALIDVGQACLVTSHLTVPGTEHVVHENGGSAKPGTAADGIPSPT
jgi:hypothetical protein